jgi:acyl-CoA reductase-like NAD-dependent aldehyde dehydrogenase/uncharacterized protein (DUF2141 family)
MNPESAEERMRRARAAVQSWSAVSVAKRISALAHFRRQIAAHLDRIVEAIVNDTGKPGLDALAGDVLVTLEHMLFYERNAARILASRNPGKSRLFFGSSTFAEHFEPHGVALVFGPANYPFQLSLAPALTALYAGNAVVLKVSERAPTVARIIAALAQDSALPTDVLQVFCDGPEAAAAYIDAGPDIVFFTGSSSNGRRVAARAAERLIPTVLELGGKDPAIVFADCNLDRTLEGITYGAFSNAGQVCVGIKRLYVERAISETFVQQLAHRVDQLRVGSGHDCDLGTLQHESAKRLFEEQVKDALERGARMETNHCGDLSGGMPIILTNVPAAARLLNEESFGPVLCVQPFTSESQAIALANSSSFALGASVWTGNLKRARRVAFALNGGACAINDVIRNIANPHAAFGGNAASGYGRYHGAEGLKTFSRIKTIMTNQARRPREINWFPMTRKNYDALHALIELRHRPYGLLAALRSLLRLFCVALTLTGGLPAHGAEAAHLWLKIETPAGATGSIAYLVFNAPDGFPQSQKKAVVHGFSAASPSGSVTTIDAGELPAGRYAVSAYLDENGNHKLDSGLFGIPREPVGASNNPAPRMGPPRFDDCAFQFGSSTQTISIQLVTPR